MKILSWNIQSTKGCDGVFDAKRICDVIAKQGEPDVICLQEISRYFVEYGGDDQLDYFTKAYPDYEPVWGAAFSWPFDGEKRREFGNLSLVKRSILSDFRVHPLPNPPADGLFQMPRVMVETRVKIKHTVFCIFNTHLAFHNVAERFEQVWHLTCLKDQGIKRSLLPEQGAGPGGYEIQDEPDHYILTGDLNLTPQSDEYSYLTGDGQWHDCWSELYPEEKHAPTCGIFDADQWNEGAHCRDYFFTTSAMEKHLVSVKVDETTDASDHQPITLELRV